MDQLITTLLNDTKAPTDLKVQYRIGNIIQLHWNPPLNTQQFGEYVKYEVSQQLCRKYKNKEYLDPSTHLLGTYKTSKPPIEVTLNLTNLVIVPKSNKPMMANQCLLRIGGITNKAKRDIKSAWSDSINIPVFHSKIIQEHLNRFVENMKNKNNSFQYNKNIDFYELQAMIADGINYKKN